MGPEAPSKPTTSPWQPSTKYEVVKASPAKTDITEVFKYDNDYVNNIDFPHQIAANNKNKVNHNVNHQIPRKRSSLPTFSAPYQDRGRDNTQRGSSLDNSFKVVRDGERHPKVPSESLFERLLSQGSSTKLHAALTPHFKEQHKQFFPEYKDDNGNTDTGDIQGRKLFCFVVRIIRNVN